MNRALLLVLTLRCLACSAPGESTPAGAGAGDGGADGDGDSDTDGDGDGDADPICDEDHPEWTVGLKWCQAGVSDGYTLLAPIGSPDVFLIDIHGREVQRWETAQRPALVTYLLENGNLLRSISTATSHPNFPKGGASGGVEEIDWAGELVWSMSIATADELSHHDLERLPNGNTIVITWERKSADEAIAAGRDPSAIDEYLLPDKLLEIQPTGDAGGEVVWEWHVWDHLVQELDPEQQNYGVVADHPELVDINHGTSAVDKHDWNHLNAVDYNAELDQLVLSSHTQDEIWVIDHSTTTAEAAGHSGGASGRGGDLLYRWGNPKVYGAGTADDQQLFGQHDAHWIAADLPGAGNLLIFDNGVGRPGPLDYSVVVEILPPLDDSGGYELGGDGLFGPAAPTWSYQAEAPEDFYSSNIAGAQRLPNGNTLVCEGSTGTIFEVTATGELVWLYVNPITKDGPLTQGDTAPLDDQGAQNALFRAYRYPVGFPAFDGIELIPGDYLELPAK